MEADNESTRRDLLIEKCGVFGCVASEGQDVKDLGVPNVICLGLVGLQHRGQESAGIVTSDGTELYIRKKMGLVGNVFGEDDMKALPGHFGIGHTRYSTAGKSELVNCQPFVVDSIHGWISVAHNGELTNAKVLRKKLLRQGVGLSTGSDTEIITQLLTAAPTCGKPAEEADWPSRIKNLMKFTELAYSLLILTSDGIFGLRDPHGNRPLCLGQLFKKGSPDSKNHLKIEDTEPKVAGWVISSESCAFTSVGAKFIREVQPGEIVQITQQGIKSIDIVPRQRAPDPSFCIFEYVYFARADSWFEGQMVYQVRRECGRQLAIEAPVEAEVVSTVPESATPAAFGFSEITGIPYIEVFTKNRYVGRTFIQPTTHLRQSSISKKFGPLSANFEGKRVIIIDDSIVRGHTMKPIIKLLKENGAKEVHIRIASPPLRYPCYMGINIPTRDELIANKMSIQELGVELGADSLEYLSIEGLVSAVQKGIPNKEEGKVGHCTACLSGKYPVELEW